jgi:acetylornithine deacetylase/succinyl-diaminopimelate desuccinylase-like protein
VDRHLRHEVERNRGGIERLTRDLIRIPSPRLYEKEAARKVEEVMRSLHYDLVFTDDVGNIVGVILGSDPTFTTVVTSHMDTVVPTRIEGWRRSPFSGDLVADRIHGVGAADAKGALAAQMFAGHVLATSRPRGRGMTVVAATVADENGCSIGVRHLLTTTLPELGMSPRFVILGEPTGLAIGTGHGGWAAVDVLIRSRVEDAARRAGNDLVEALRPFCEGGGVEPPLAITAVAAPREDHSGRGFLATVRICLRLFPGETVRDGVGWLEGSVARIVGRTPEAAATVTVHEEDQQLYTGHTKRVRFSVPPWSTDVAQPLVERARSVMLEVGCAWKPMPWRLNRLGSGTAGSVVASELGVPVIGYGPGDEGQAHACNESVSLRALVNAAHGTAILMEGLSAAQAALALQAARVDVAAVRARSTRDRPGGRGAPRGAPPTAR